MTDIKALIVCDRQFRTKTELESFVREILSRYDAGERLNPEDYAFTRELLMCNPSASWMWVEKTVAIEVESCGPDQKRFCIIRSDGGRRDVSFRKCISPPPVMSHLLHVFRTAVADQIGAFRNGSFDNGATLRRCLNCGIDLYLSDGKNHVDHEPPLTFEALVMQWLSMNNKKPEDIETYKSPIYGEPSRVKNRAIEYSWRAFHLHHSRQRILCSVCNLSTTRKKQGS
jgi:hypothetical protein